MNQDYRHQQYGQQIGFDHYDLPPVRKNILEKILGERLASRASNPLVATAVVLLCGAVFAGVIVASYPDSKDGGDSIPVVKADTLAYKETPQEPGGMEIPNQGSTIFQSMAAGTAKESAPIENLLADEEPAEKLAAFQRQVEDITALEKQGEASKAEPSSPAEQEASQNIASAEKPAEAIELTKIVSPAEEKTSETLKEGAAEVIPPEEEDLASASIDIPAPVPPKEAQGASPVSQKPEITHKAGENPETIEFVRSVLNRKDGIAPDAAEAKTAQAASPKTAEAASKVEPASGAAIAAGSYYIQLGSVTSEVGASSEWGKLQKAFPSQLASLSYRVQKAELGERGTYYRIQAGPISKDSAKSLCESITAQKPGGCLVTQ